MSDKLGAVLFAISVAGLAAAEPPAQSIQRVMLISIDGMHAVDYQNCMNTGLCPNLASLGKHGVNYTNTSTSKPSDSFPGLMALVTGASPKSHGAYYDLAYDRVLAPPLNTTGNGLAGGSCHAGFVNGTTTEYEEGVELDQSKLNGGSPFYSLTDGGTRSIDPTRLPRDPFNGCLPVYPWQFIRTNSIYGVIHKHGGYTAWSDKHAVYAAVSGHGDTAGNVDDYYSPEINSNVIGLKGVHTATHHNCAEPTGSATWVDDFTDIQCYDTLKVEAILNEIDGRSHDGSLKTTVPNIFGMNFQAVSVGQKLIENGTKGGYLDAAGTFSGPLAGEIAFVDASIGQMLIELQQHSLLESTLIIITAKHGQSPIDPSRFQELGHGITTTPADLIAALLPPSESPLNPNNAGPTQDDISLLWLANSSNTASAVTTLMANVVPAQISQIFSGASLSAMFDAPGLPPLDPRTPDIIVQPVPGVVYTGSSHKQAEHGGFAHDDTNVMILVSNPSFAPSTVTTFVQTMQVAPTILKALGLNPGELDGVVLEGTQALPGLPLP